jgi:ABC-type ATPase involved in cell division
MDLLVSAATRGTAVFVATHDSALIERYGRRTVKLEDGHIVEDLPGIRELP